MLPALAIEYLGQLCKWPCIGNRLAGSVRLDTDDACVPCLKGKLREWTIGSHPSPYLSIRPATSARLWSQSRDLGASRMGVQLT